MRSLIIIRKNRAYSIPIFPLVAVFILIAAFLIAVYVPPLSMPKYRRTLEKVQAAIDAHEKEVVLEKPLGSKIFDDVLSRVQYAEIGNPDVQSFSYYDERDCYRLQISYSSLDRDKAVAEQEKMLDAIVAFAPPGATDRELAKWAHDYLLDHFAYDYSMNNHSAYSMLRDGKGVCSAYAALYQAIMERFGIPCVCVTGETEKGSGALFGLAHHAWNLVKLGGKWYHVDTTWDDTGTDREEYFLVSDFYMRKHYHHRWHAVDHRRYYAFFNASGK